MTKKERKEKIKEIQQIDAEIKDLISFMKLLEWQLTVNENVRHTSALIKQVTKTKIFGVFSKTDSIEIDIPDKMVAEIAAKCQKWVIELEERANEIFEPKQ